mmetsp:Transcript_20446/g.30988  ORF Transcript_20446/g.30988 Transcript_20446/m.30988 type:complete len:388 (+) Transcript_20446:127-1290(+)
MLYSLQKPVVRLAASLSSCRNLTNATTKPKLCTASRTCTGAARRRQFGSNSPASSNNKHHNHTTTISRWELEKLQAEIKALQELSKVHQSMLSEFRSSSEQQTKTIFDLLEQMKEHIVKISTVERISMASRDYFQQNETLTQIVKSMQNRSWNFLTNKYVLGGVAAVILVGWSYRSTMRARASEEVAGIAALTLQQSELRETIQETLHTVANSPETLNTLNELLLKLIQSPQTVKALVDLVVHALQTPDVRSAVMQLLEEIFRDKHLQQLTGDFLLNGLNYHKDFLESQTQDLVRQTVLDQSVQRATGMGVQRSLWYAMVPPFLWNHSTPITTTSSREQQKMKEGQNIEPSINIKNAAEFINHDDVTKGADMSTMEPTLSEEDILPV